MNREGTDAAAFAESIRQNREDAFRLGVAVAGARTVGIVAAELGDDHPLLDRIVIALGALSRE